jgi:sugar phosphate isomerase/epimerase
MNPISMMAWRIGNLLDMAEQVQWTQSHGFTGISLHASAGTPGQWQGLDPATCLPSDRADWRKRLSAFAAREIHAPFAAAITGRDDDAALLALDETLAFAHDLDADIVTIHAEVPTDPPLRQAWRKSTRQLAALARQHHVQVGLEVTSGFDEILDLDEPHLGVTLDVGHMYHRDAAPLAAFAGDIGRVVRLLGEKLVHLHIHDIVGATDHVAPGTGQVDWQRLFAALRETAYQGMFCLELNPDRVTPDGIQASREWLEAHWARQG